eukprot:11089973-Ditylum_brightwellii.AAC.1
MAQAKKMLKGKTIFYSWQYKKPDLESSMFYILQQQMKKGRKTRQQESSSCSLCVWSTIP